jgi:hypothetical protein
MRHALRVTLIAAGTAALSALPARAQVLGTFSWQTQPYCNVVSVTVIQQGSSYELQGSDNLCGAGVAPVSGLAILGGPGVTMGLTVAYPSGRAAHLTAAISIATVSGTWSDADGNSGAFAFGQASGGGPRPEPAAATGITVNQFSPTVFAGTGSAATIARSDHLHDDRYYTEAEVDAAVAAAVTASEAKTLFATVAPANATPVLVRGRGATAVSPIGTGWQVTFNRDVTTCTWQATYGPATNTAVDSRWATVRGLSGNNTVMVVLRDDLGAQVTGAGFHLAVFCP